MTVGQPALYRTWTLKTLQFQWVHEVSLGPSLFELALQIPCNISKVQEDMHKGKEDG